MNTQHLILSPTGKRLYSVGEHYHQRFEHGDYHVSIEWHNEGRSCEPVMCIWRPNSLEGGVFAICLSSIGKYADPSGNPTPECFRECWKSLPILGRAQIDMECHDLVDIVIRHTPDLINCPVEPEEQRRAEAGSAFFEITKTDANGKVISEHLI
jgi:hypothetical protein